MKIGSVDLGDRPLLLAPMEDVTDPSFRFMCKHFGADMMYTEFINADGLIRDAGSSVAKLNIYDYERPIGIQLYGHIIESMVEAARVATTANPEIIDINFGCPVKKIANRGAGSGMMRDVPKMVEMTKQIVNATQLPVTVKTRLGWDHTSIVILDVARMLEDLGIAALTLHCRTRCQGYTGEADWAWITRVKEVSSIPLIANGDIITPRDAETCFNLGADGVMIGRGAIHSPWVFRHIRHYFETGEILPDPSLEERMALCIRHLTEHTAYRGERRGVLSFRRHYAGYLKGVPHIAQLRKELMELEEVAPIIERLNRFLVEFNDYIASEEGS